MQLSFLINIFWKTNLDNFFIFSAMFFEKNFFHKMTFEDKFDFFDIQVIFRNINIFR